MRFTARAFKRRLSRRRKQKSQRTRRIKRRRQHGGATIPNTNPSLEDLEREGAVITNPLKERDEYEPFQVVEKEVDTA